MKSFRVEWSIDVDAETVRDAALLAWCIQHDPFSTAECFTVRDGETLNHIADVDLGLHRKDGAS